MNDTSDPRPQRGFSLARGFAVLRERFDLIHDSERSPDDEVIAAITRGMELRGATLWVLVFAILIASIGLNVNSIAVIIGAMLISPLMGPIMAIGVGIGIYDFDLIKKSLSSFGVAVAASLATSTLYFLLTPLDGAQSELIGRTHPTVWDVLVAACGGFAGTIGVTRRTWNNVVPGVAIATALMPPLCTAGYGIASGQPAFFFGAFYLFVINSVFIGLSSVLVVRMMRFSRRSFVDHATEKRVQRYVLTFVVLTVVPSVYLTYQIVTKDVFSRAEKSFVEKEIDSDETKVLNHRVELRDGNPELVVMILGRPLTQEQIDTAQAHLAYYGLSDVKLVIKTASAAPQKIDMSGVRAGIVEELFTRREAEIKKRDEELRSLKTTLDRVRVSDEETAALFAELKAQQPSLRKLLVAKAGAHDGTDAASTAPVEPELIVIASLTKPLTSAQQRTTEAWFAARTGYSRVKLIVERSK